MIKKKNIAILVWSLNTGGAERIAGLLSIYLSEKYNVYLFLRNTENIVYDYSGTIVNVQPTNKLEYCEENVALAKVKYNIFCSISFLDDMNNINIRTKNKDKVIVSSRCTLSYFSRPYYSLQYQMRKYYNNADAIVAASDGVKHEMVSEYGINPNKVVTIYNFIQQDVIKKKAIDGLELDLKEKKLLVSMGRLVDQKNYIRLLRQFALLRKRKDDVFLIIIGSGELKESIQKEIERLRIQNDVEMISYCRNPFSYLNRANAYVTASHFEGCPNAVLEAMTLNLPIVATDCVGGPRELLGGINDYSIEMKGIKKCDRGILVEDVKTDDDCRTTYLSEAMAIVLDDKEYINKVKNEQKKFMGEYSNENILNQWISVIEDTTNNNRAFSEEMNQNKSIVIYGAGKLGREALELCRRKGVTVIGFLVSKHENNPQSIDDIPVMTCEEYSLDKSDTQVVMGLSELMQDEAVGYLLENGFDDFYYPRFEESIERIINQRR